MKNSEKLTKESAKGNKKKRAHKIFQTKFAQNKCKQIKMKSKPHIQNG